MTNNIISHNCVGARICQQIGMEYGNPFMWCVIPPEDFYYLYIHYHEINYKNIKVEEVGSDYKVLIDDKVSIYYVHYKYDENSSEPSRKDSINIYYDKIKDYVIEKYNTRLKRMTNIPVFIVTDREFDKKPWCNFEKKDLLKYVGKQNCIVATCDKTIMGDNVIYYENKTLDPIEIAKIILENNDIKLFLGDA